MPFLGLGLKGKRRLDDLVGGFEIFLDVGGRDEEVISVGREATATFAVVREFGSGLGGKPEEVSQGVLILCLVQPWDSDMAGFTDLRPIDIVEALVNPVHHQGPLFCSGERFLGGHLLGLNLLKHEEPVFAIGKDLLSSFVWGEVKVASGLFLVVALVTIFLKERLNVLFEGVGLE